jgi:hypothetical protein
VLVGAWSLRDGRGGLARSRQGGVVGELEDLGLVEQAVEAVRLEGCGEVEDGAGGGGDGDALVAGDLGGTERPRSVDPQSPALHTAGAARHADVDDRRPAAAQVPERGGTRVAQRGTGTGSEDGGHPMSARREDGVADGVHTSVESMQPARIRAAIDRVIREAKLAEL